MFTYPKRYDVIVVGGGHAGIEAALAAARMGCETLLITLNPDSIGQMSCNPAVGGLAKGHLVREIDALGGEMGRTTDLCGLQFRMLNRTKGPAVWSPRAQCDKKAYQLRMKRVCEQQNRLETLQAQVVGILEEQGMVKGVEVIPSGIVHGNCVVLTTGTFLRGLMHVGQDQQAGGRAGDSAAVGLSDSLIKIGLGIGRMKTGTPPRLLRRSIDFSKTETQEGDREIPYFTNWRDELFHMEHGTSENGGPNQNSQYPAGSILESIPGQLPCHITYTSRSTADIIHANLFKSPMYSGTIKGVGPRYCPSIEDKIVRFADKERHQIFLEPEGVQTEEIYVNGLSTSLPSEVQWDLVRSVIGCENAHIIRPAYAVEYDYVFPNQLTSCLEAKTCGNLFLAGQINGTSGYEEAAAQGIIAGINAALRACGKTGLCLSRDQAYVGVLIDDLVTKEIAEPYRLFTSRAEYRLLLRQDNADLRLSRIGYEVGLLTLERYNKVRAKQSAIAEEMLRLSKTRFGQQTLSQILSRPEMSYDALPSRNDSLAQEVRRQVEIEVKYSGYIHRQYIDIERVKTILSKQIPPSFDYASVPGLRLEARQKFAQIKPSTLGQASRISGVSPADLSLLIVWLKRANLATTATEF